ncbi:MAG: metallophosphoesterase family protein [Gaiellaceae bacterium]
MGHDLRPAPGRRGLRRRRARLPRRALHRVGARLKLAVISDTHLPRGSRALPQECLRLLGDADLILHAGDVVAAAVLEELRKLAPVEAVRGNMDEPELRAALPERRVVETGGVRLGMVHDPGPLAGRPARLAALFPGCDAVVCGHTHVPQVESHDGVWILNPGSPTERRRAPFRSMLLAEVDAEGLRPRLHPLP